MSENMNIKKQQNFLPGKAIFCLVFYLALNLLSGAFGGFNGYAKEMQPHYLSFSNVTELKTYLKWAPGKKAIISAHRGGPMKGFPENAVETFENILRYGPCMIECDVRLSKDGILVMMHDDTLERTTNGSGNVTDYTFDQLKKLFLKDPMGKITPYRIPSFAQALKWAKGRAVLAVDVKRKIPYKKVIEEIREYEAEPHVVVITYNWEQLQEVYRLAPELMVSAGAKGVMGTQKLLASGVPASNLCVFVGVYEPKKQVYDLLHEKGILTILGTMHNLDKKAEARGLHVYRELVKNGADILATDNPVMATRAINARQR